MRIVPRREWGATGALPKERMSLPARALIVHHTVTTVTPSPYHDMREVEKIGIRRFGHISYSYCIHPDGTVMEGCGNRRGAHTQGRNSTTYGIALIGDYDKRNLTVWQADAIRWLAAHLVTRGDLRAGIHPEGGHRDYSATACPGANAYRVLDMMRIPWTIQNQETPMADNPDLPNIEGPLQLVVVADQAGNATGYYIFSISTGELHSFGPGAKYYGRSEELTPD